jgi:hypothetical protein
MMRFPERRERRKNQEILCPKRQTPARWDEAGEQAE